MFDIIIHWISLFDFQSIKCELSTRYLTAMFKQNLNHAKNLSHKYNKGLTTYDAGINSKTNPSKN